VMRRRKRDMVAETKLGLAVLGAIVDALID
jgi:hypothetical protein